MDSKILSLLAARKFRNQCAHTKFSQKTAKNEKVQRFVDDAACFL
jgi:hypothetical protein